MRRLLIVACAMIAVAPQVQARRIYIPPTPDRLATASCAVIGKITEIEKKSVVATASAGDPQKYEYQVAVIKVEKALAGAKGLTHVRVGLRGPAVQQERRNRGAADLAFNAAVGQAGCFFLHKHHEQPFFTLDPIQGFVTRESDPAGYAALERCARLLDDPRAGLTAKDADDRYFTAAMLVARYRQPLPEFRTEPIDAEESKLILLALRDADWNRKAGDRLHPQQTFARLGLTPQDGWQQPKDFKQYEAAAKEWLKKHAGTYRLQRFVANQK